jgi:hypothetical protein
VTDLRHRSAFSKAPSRHPHARTLRQTQGTREGISNPRWNIILASSGKPIFFYLSAEDKPMAGRDFSPAQPLLAPQIP